MSFFSEGFLFGMQAITGRILFFPGGLSKWKFLFSGKGQTRLEGSRKAELYPNVPGLGGGFAPRPPRDRAKQSPLFVFPLTALLDFG